MTYLAATKETVWRATGTYSPKLASKAGLVEEAKLFLTTYAQLRNLSATSKALVDGVLPQRSRETRATIVGILRRRLVLWNPPTWVLDDLVSFASDTNPDTFRVALLLHTSRQERLLYDFVQQVLVPHWYAGMHKAIRSDVQGFLDTAQEEHPEVILPRIGRVSKAEIYYQNQEGDHLWQRFKKSTHENSKRKRCGWPKLQASRSHKSPARWASPIARCMDGAKN